MKISNLEVTPIHSERWGDDLDVVNAARVSFSKEADWVIADHGDHEVYRLHDKDVKLVNYLAKHKHFSPFNHSFLSFRIKAPIFVARQLVKHKFMPWNEVSRRYVDEEPEFYWPDSFRKKADNVKQGSSDEAVNLGRFFPIEAIEAALFTYEGLLERDVAPEQARMVLPQNMMTEWIWSGTLGAFLDMLVLRLDPHTQKESRDVAEMIAMHVQKVFPISYKARIEQ